MHILKNRRCAPRTNRRKQSHQHPNETPQNTKNWHPKHFKWPPKHFNWPPKHFKWPLAVDSSTQLQDCMLLLYQRQCNADEGGFWGIADGGETAEKRRPFWAFWVFFFGLFCLVLTSLSRRGACAHSAYAKKGSFRSALPENPSVSRAASRIGRPV